MTQRITIGKLGTVAVEILWLPFDRATASSSDDLRTLASQYEASAVVDWQARNKATVGLDDSKVEEASHVPSLALILVEAIPGNWVGIFEYEEGYWLCAANNGHPYPLGDILFSAEQDTDAIASLREIRDILGLSQIYAPTHLKIDGAEELTLGDFKDASQQTILRSPEPSWGSVVKTYARTHIKAIAACSALLISGTAGYISYENWIAAQTEAQRLIDARLVAVEQQNTAKLRAKTDAQEFRKKWEEIPVPSVHLATCIRTLRQLSRPIASWSNGTKKCVDSTVSVAKKREGGNNKRLRMKAAQISAQAVENGTDNFVLTKLWERPSYRGPHVLGLLSPAKRALQNFVAGNAGITLNFSLPESIGSPVEDDDELFSTSFTIAGIYNLPPLNIALDARPGLGISSATRHTSGKWTIEGVIYHVKSE